jgi:phosphoadenosine phosphosulfate reductase
MEEERMESVEQLPARGVMEWALRQFTGRVALSASFGGGGLVLAHMLSEIDRSVPVLFIDTGFLFNETLVFRDAFATRYGLNVVTLTPAEDPGPLYRTDPDRCCAIRKVEPMQRVLPGYDAWISAIRRNQTESRAQLRVIEEHDTGGRALLKIHPLASWSRDDVARYLHDHDIPEHPLSRRGYTSIGCWPCTRPTKAGEHERAGRWSGSGKTECGLHTIATREVDPVA